MSAIIIILFEVGPVTVITLNGVLLDFTEFSCTVRVRLSLRV